MNAKVAAFLPPTPLSIYAEGKVDAVTFSTGTGGTLGGQSVLQLYINRKYLLDCIYSEMHVH